MLSNLFFTKISKVHPGPCTRDFLITGLHGSGTVWIICFALSSTDLLGVGQQGGLSSHCYSDGYITVGICPIVGLFIFIRFVSNTLALWKSLRTPIRSWSFPSNSLFVRCFQRRICGCRWIHCKNPHEMMRFLLPNIISGILSFYRLLIYNRLYGGVLAGL